MIHDKLDEAINWLDENQNAEKSEMDQYQQDLQEIIMPVLSKYMNVDNDVNSHDNDVNNMSTSSTNKDGPTIEEVLTKYSYPYRSIWSTTIHMITFSI